MKLEHSINDGGYNIPCDRTLGLRTFCNITCVEEGSEMGENETKRWVGGNEDWGWIWWKWENGNLWKCWGWWREILNWESAGLGTTSRYAGRNQYEEATLRWGREVQKLAQIVWQCVAERLVKTSQLFFIILLWDSPNSPTGSSGIYSNVSKNKYSQSINRGQVNRGQQLKTYQAWKRKKQRFTKKPRIELSLSSYLKKNESISTLWVVLSVVCFLSCTQCTSLSLSILNLSFVTFPFCFPLWDHFSTFSGFTFV